MISPSSRRPLRASEARPSISTSGVTERDIDLLLLEEFVASRAFRGWFLEQLGRPHLRYRLESAQRSVTQSLGESDLEITLAWKEGKIRLLIENKVGAGLQPRQAERYAERARMYVTRGECEECITVLVTPNGYAGERDRLRGFEHHVSYEAIRGWFETALLGARGHCKVEMLSNAIEKAVLGYNPVADKPVTEFWQAYWQLQCEHAPELELARPPGRPSRSRWMRFFPRGLRRDGLPVKPSTVMIVHKGLHGFVDLQFARLGPAMPTIQQLSRDNLPAGATIERAKGSVALRLHVPPLNAGISFASQEALALEGILAAKRWLAWAQRRSTVVEGILALAPPSRRNARRGSAGRGAH